ncbi:MAG: hypothetical protein FWD01_04040 [Defluviitaleaceae bacterium]|nr:hypothetical protein [Defluviitaleaceae bacterium]
METIDFRNQISLPRKASNPNEPLRLGELIQELPIEIKENMPTQAETEQMPKGNIVYVEAEGQDPGFSSGYNPPEGGIPKQDLAQNVQDLLHLADSALQEGDINFPAPFQVFENAPSQSEINALDIPTLIFVKGEGREIDGGSDSGGENGNDKEPKIADISDWEVHSLSGFGRNWGQIVFGQGIFVAVAHTGLQSQRIMTSPNGINWTLRNHPAADFQFLAYGNGVFVAVGINVVMTSPDGINWTQGTIPGNTWVRVHYGNGMFIATAQNTNAAVSPDGINWTAITIPIPSPFRCHFTYGNGMFVGVARTGINQVMTSPDGINWTARTAPNDNRWFSITFGKGKFVAVANGGTGNWNQSGVMTSPDGINWTTHEIPMNSWSSVTYSRGIFVAVAPGASGSTFASNHSAMTSLDGINWISRPTPFSGDWLSIAYGNGMFVAVEGIVDSRATVMVAHAVELPVSQAIGKLLALGECKINALAQEIDDFSKAFLAILPPEDLQKYNSEIERINREREGQKEQEE